MPGRLMTTSLPWRDTSELPTPSPLTRFSMMFTASSSSAPVAVPCGLEHHGHAAAQVETEKDGVARRDGRGQGDRSQDDDADEGPDEAAPHGSGVAGGREVLVLIAACGRAEIRVGGR